MKRAKDTSHIVQTRATNVPGGDGDGWWVALEMHERRRTDRNGAEGTQAPPHKVQVTKIGTREAA